MRCLLAIRRPHAWYHRAWTRWLARRDADAAPAIAAAAAKAAPRCVRAGDFDILLY